MKVSFIFLVILSLANLVKCGYLTGHHPLPSNLITSRTTIGGAVGGGPSSGAYSSSQLVQTVSTSPNQFQSSFSTHHPSQYGYYNRANQISGINPIQFTPNQGQNQGNNQNYGYTQNQGQNYNGYNTNIPSVIAYGSYGYNGNLGNPGQGGPGQLQGGQPQSQGESNQNQGRYYQSQSHQYSENNAQGQNGYGRF